MIFHALDFSVVVILVSIDLDSFKTKRFKFEIPGTLRVCIKTNLGLMLKN